MSELVQFNFTAMIDTSVKDRSVIIVHTRHLVEGVVYDSSVYLATAWDDITPEHAIMQGVQAATQQVDYVVQSTRDMRIL